MLKNKQISKPLEYISWQCVYNTSVIWRKKQDKQRLYPSSFKLQGCWPRSFTRITYLSKLIGIHSLAAFLQLEIYRVKNFSADYIGNHIAALIPLRDHLKMISIAEL